jgi:hypothetical protein
MRRVTLPCRRVMRVWPSNLDHHVEFRHCHLREAHDPTFVQQWDSSLVTDQTWRIHRQRGVFPFLVTVA